MLPSSWTLFIFVCSLLKTSLKVMAGILEAGLSSRCSGFYWWLSKMSSPCLAKPGRCSSPVDLEGASDASQAHGCLGLGSSDWADV